MRRLMLRAVTVQHYMLQDPVLVTPDTYLLAAAQLIIDKQVSGLTVVDELGRLVGIVSETDCLTVITGQAYDGNYHPEKVGDIMIRDRLLTASPGDNIIEVATSMMEHRHRRRPVVEDGKVVGLVTCRRLLKAIKSFLEPSPPDPEQKA